MTNLKWLILALIIAGVVLAGIYLNKWLFGAACIIGGMVVENNRNGIYRWLRG